MYNKRLIHSRIPEERETLTRDNAACFPERVDSIGANKKREELRLWIGIPD
jgi:hypothetical protein